MKRAHIFGAALDCLDDPERVAMKQAYLSALAEGRLGPDSLSRDPYDALLPLLLGFSPRKIMAKGKVEIPSWLTPRPKFEDRNQVTPHAYRDFMEGKGFKEIVEECRVMASRILPSVPVMLAVDHALSAGPIRAVSKEVGPENLCVLVFDAHFDAIPPRLRGEGNPSADFSGEELCGCFLAALIEEGTLPPENLVVFGVSDFPGGEAKRTAFGKQYLSLLRRGVKVITRSEAREKGIGPALEQALSSVPAENLYLSLDLDAGAFSAFNAVRFPDSPGFSWSEIKEAARTTAGLCRSRRFRLSGMDVCEMDVHLLGLSGPEGEPDRTAERGARFVLEVLEGGL